MNRFMVIWILLTCSLFAGYSFDEYPPGWTLDSPFAIVGCVFVIAFGYFVLAWGGGAIGLWRNPLGFLGGSVAILIGAACIGSGLWYLVH